MSLDEYIALASQLVTMEPPAYFELAVEAQALYRAHRDRWKPMWGMPDANVKLYAGMPSRIAIDGRKDPDLGKVGDVIADQPVVAVTLKEMTPTAMKKVLARCERVEELSLQTDKLQAAAAKKAPALFAKAKLPAVRSLTLDRIELDDDDLIHVMDALPALVRLQGQFRKSLPRWSRAAQLEHVGGSSVWTSTVRELRVKSVGAANLIVDDPGALTDVTAIGVSITQAQHWLRLVPNATTVRMLADLVDADRPVIDASPVWEHVEELVVGSKPNPNLVWFVETILPRCTALRSLRIAAMPGMTLDHMPHLVKLELTNPRGIDLADIPPPTVKTLMLSGDVKGVPALIARGLPLVTLGLWTGHVASEWIHALIAATPTLMRIETAAILQDLQDAPSHGCYLGPSWDMVGPQREPIWSYEP
ncbi:MAG: hypothetical protein QM831_05585 [Kofleriaceae bacterium]